MITRTIYILTITFLIWSCGHRQIEIKNVEQLVCKTVSNSQIVFCEYQDTITFDRYIICSDKIQSDKNYLNSIIDAINIGHLSDDKTIEFGSIEINNGIDNILIAIEARTTLVNSEKIFQAWTFDFQTKKFVDVNVKGLHRINEGYYRK